MRLFILGAGGHAKVVLATVMEAGLEVAGILDDDPSKWGTDLLGIPVLGPLSWLKRESEPWAILAIGDNATRKRLDQELQGVRWAKVVHPKAYVHPTAVIGEGTVVLVGAIVQPMARIGRHVIINTGAIVEHDCQVGDFAHLAPGVRLAGGVKVGEACLLGVGTSVVPQVCIGDGSVVGAGSVVVRDIPPGVVAYGIPAQVRRRLL